MKAPGHYGDGRGGHGLSLLVKPASSGRLSKTWSQRLRPNGRPTNIGLGSYPVVTLAEARAEALENRRAVAQGRDPRRGAGVLSFAEAAETVIGIHAAGWRDGGKSEQQWRASLRDYAMPRLGCRPVDAITTADVMAVLTPIWGEKRVTAQRVRQRIGAIMKWAIAQDYRNDNPAGEAIAAALPRNNGAKEHHRALPHGEVGAALARVRASEAWPATKLAFEFLVLTACRSGEVRGARWREVNFGERLWVIPPERMKANRPLQVPLSGRALEVLAEARAISGSSELVFPSPTGKQLAALSLSKLCRDLGLAGTPHGMRSAFRSWAAEQGVPREVAEQALGHVVQGVEGAYQRSDLLERRLVLMGEWAGYVAGGGGRG